MTLAVAILVLFALLMALVSFTMSASDRQSLAEALVAPRHSPRSGWANAFRETLGGLVLGDGSRLRRILTGLLISILLYAYLALAQWVVGERDVGMLKQLALAWAFFGVAIGWPKDLIAQDQARRYVKNMERAHGWTAATGGTVEAGFFRRVGRLGLHVTALAVHGAIALVGAVGVALVALLTASALDLVPHLVGWSEVVLDGAAHARVEPDWLVSSVPVPALQAGYMIVLAATTIVPFAIVLLFALTWSITRFVFRYDRWPPPKYPVRRMLLVGLPLSVPFFLAIVGGSSWIVQWLGGAASAWSGGG